MQTQFHFHLENLKGSAHVGVPGVDRSIILKWMIKLSIMP